LKRWAWFRIHSFTGVITGLILFVICWSGTFAVISHELDWLTTPDTSYAIQNKPESWDQIQSLVQSAYSDATQVAYLAPEYPWTMTMVLINKPNQSGVLVQIDASKGRIHSATSSYNIARFFRSFHRNLFLPVSWGVLIVSAFAVTLAVSLFAALRLYRGWWKRFLEWPRGERRAFWSGVHKTAGLWSLWFGMIMVVTGVWYGFERIRLDHLDGIEAYVGTSDAVVIKAPKPASNPDLPLLSLDELITRARQFRPDLDIRTISPVFFTPPGVLYVDGQAGHFMVRNRANQLHLDMRTGEVLYSQKATDLPFYWRWSHTADPLHFGYFGGLWSKAVWFVFGLVLSGIILTGTWLHVNRLARETGGISRHRWPCTMAAIVISLIVVGASVPFGFEFARENFGPMVNGVKHLPALRPGARVVIIGWIALTLAILTIWIALLWRPHWVLRKHHINRPAKN